MKTRNENRKMSFKGLFYLLMVSMIISTSSASSQDDDSTESLFRSDVNVTELWTPEIKINSIQGGIGTLAGIYGGALINKTFLVGISGGVNIGHPRVNYGYFGGIAQYIHNPSRLVHWSSQIVLAYGSTKDYENPKSGLLDNFWNISGAHFFIMEPGVNIEVNLSGRTSLVAGMSYRFVTGLDENNENISITHVNNRDMSGLNFNIGLKIGKKPKVN
ncbi:MAG: hypothetical protein HGA23_09395 [Bacteroidales bacterium]|nr:hypothetical protein [Bacteroidales bacterium]